MLRKQKQATKRDVLGFRLPMLTHEEPTLDITDTTVVDPENTFYMRMGSEAMTGYHILKDHVLIIDRSLQPVPGSIVAFFHEGGFYTREYVPQKNGLLLKAAPRGNDRYRKYRSVAMLGRGNGDTEPGFTAGSPQREVWKCLRMLISIIAMSAASGSSAPNWRAG